MTAAAPRRGPRALWRSSLILRVVTSTVVLSLAVLAILGPLLLHRVATGLLDARRQTVLAEAVAQVGSADQIAQAASGGSSTSIAHQIAVSVASRPAGSLDFDLIVLTGGSPVAGFAVPDTVSASSVPAALAAELSSGRTSLASQFGTIDQAGTAAAPALVVGASVTPVTGQVVTVFYLFPLTSVQTTLALVQRTVLIAGAVLVLLLAAIAALVTRQVVTPVRLAARTAESLAAGLLTERMEVRGDDDLARLARSFNEMASALSAHIDELEELSRLQQRFVADVSHELRTPLTTVRMAADVLYDAREQFDPATSRSAELLHTEIGRFEALLLDLLEISRFDAGVAALDVEATDVAGLVERVADALARTAADDGVEIVVRRPRDPVIADVDPRRVQRIVRNLVVNAVEHAESQPVDVIVAATDSTVLVAVRDHGVGLSADQAEHVFDRFWRADPARARRHGGTGLGLAIAQEDTALHGGQLDVDGRLGDGALFRLLLPRHDGQAVDDLPSPLRIGGRD